jgi:NADPH:quinone reductase-like Zn-dependent oxidoreductase
MKAAVRDRYGSPDVLEIREIETPEPKPGEVLVRVHATTVTRTDHGMLLPDPWWIRPILGWWRPKVRILGLDFAGIVESVGVGTSKFGPGDRVFGMSLGRFGAHADYLCVPEDGAIAAIPGGRSFDEVVACEGAYYADTHMKAFDLGRGDTILVYGASGAIGTAAVQLAKARGAHVTAVVATRHLDLVRGLGADRVIDYTAQDFTAIGERFDFVMDAVGKTTYFRCRELLEPGGVYAATDLGPGLQNVWLTLGSAITRSRRVIFPLPGSGRGHAAYLAGLMEAGRFRAVVDRRYPLSRIAEAYRYVATGEKTGIVVIEVAPAR